MSRTQGHEIPLEKLKFKEGFNRHTKPSHSKEEEAFALLSYLVPIVKDEVTYLGEDIEKIWDRLDRKYGDENKLINLIMNDIKHIPLCRDSHTDFSSDGS